MNDRTISTLCKKKVQIKKNYDNAKCDIKSHTSSYANVLPSQKLISDSPSRTEISSASKVALCLLPTTDYISLQS